jgi:hypothetical protein
MNDDERAELLGEATGIIQGWIDAYYSNRQDEQLMILPSVSFVNKMSERWKLAETSQL